MPLQAMNQDQQLNRKRTQTRAESIMNMNCRSDLLSLFTNGLLVKGTYICMVIPDRSDRDGVVRAANAKVEDEKNKVSVVLHT